MAKAARRQALGRARGATLIELMIGVGVLAVVAMLAAPAVSDWIRNARVRSLAETLRADLQMARAEAIRRNVGTRLQFVSTQTSDCALSTASPLWVTSLYLAKTPVGACGSSLDTGTAPYLIGKSVSTTSADLAVSASRAVIGFDSLGRMAATTNPDTTAAQATIEFSSASGTCLAAGGRVRCMKVIVSPSGDTRICDPTRSSTTDPTDPLVCPSS
ncbi:MAG: GspH/FimT family pseudopilin [Acidovorax sp.]|uniref:GspH/FimT family pseudopilin n=1 Tax=Acidovorax sp. TaxID=1872122 RepID=UPI0039E5DD5C